VPKLPHNTAMKLTSAVDWLNDWAHGEIKHARLSLRLERRRSQLMAWPLAGAPDLTVPRHEYALRSLAAGLGVGLVALGLVGLRDFLVGPSGRLLPPPLEFLLLGWPVPIAAGAVLLLLRNPGRAASAPPSRRGPLACIAVGGALLVLGTAGWGWRRFTEQEEGFLGSVLFILAFPAGLLLTLLGATLWVYRRYQRSAL